MNKLRKIITITLFGIMVGGFMAPVVLPSYASASQQPSRLDTNGGNSDVTVDDLLEASRKNQQEKEDAENPDKETGPSTSILPSDWKIENLLNLVLVILTAGIGIAASVAFVVAGVLYSTAAGSAAQVQKAKTMILNTVIGLIAYSLLWAFAQWLIPGGVF